jgi:DNA adenine methylase
MTDELRAPFPAFGGKSRAARLVWERFGTPINYVEPFVFSAAMLLACPSSQRPRVETINDVSCFIANFWRAVRADPETVAREADYPVIETDLHARHQWLLARAEELRAKLDADPEYFDARIAAWWVWGASAWIGSGWCEDGEDGAARAKLPHLRPGRDTGQIALFG